MNVPEGWHRDGWAIRDAAGVVLARVARRGPGDSAAWREDTANLMAAASDLHAALEAIMEDNRGRLRPGTDAENEHLQRAAELLARLKRPKRMLLSGQDTPAIKRRVLAAARGLLKREALEAVFEHGQWWVFAPDGSQWACEDGTGPGTADGFTFERVSEARDA